MVLIMISYYFISIPFIVFHYKKYSITPTLVFLSMQVLMFSGLLLSKDYPVYYYNKLIIIYFVALIFFIFGVSIINMKSRNIKQKFSNIDKMRHKQQEYLSLDPTNYQLFIIFALIGVSIFVCLWLFSTTGINIFLESIKGFINGNTVIYTEERRSFGDIPLLGYIHQFRTIILPILNIYLILGLKNKKLKKIGLLILPFTILFVLGTGQRNAFVFVLMFTLIYVLALREGYKLNISKLKFSMIVMLSVFFLIILTISNGRVSNGAENIYSEALFSLIDRIVGINSRSALNAFMYIDTQPTVWGYDWLMMLAEILPNDVGYTSVASITYQILYGTYKGTEPPCIWGSAYYNWSWLGVIIMPFLLGMIYQSVYIRFKNRKKKTKLDVLIYAALCTFLGLWISDSPMVLFNNGVITILIMSLLLKFKVSKKTKVSNYKINTMNNEF